VRPLHLGDDRDGFVYTPRSYRPGMPTPLVLMLHGANGGASLSEERRALVDELGCIWLAPDSRDPRSWDLLRGGFGPDVDFIADALQQVYAGWSIDRRRLAIAGTSDGGSYALSLGLGIGDVFGWQLAVVSWQLAVGSWQFTVVSWQF
jgi:phospholipase/carboxylesterase